MATVIGLDNMDTEPQKLLRWAKNKDLLRTTTSSSSSSSSSASAPPPTTEGGADHGDNFCKSINFRRQRFLKSFSFTMPEEQEKKSGIVASSRRMINRLGRSLGCSSSGCLKVYDSHRSSSRLSCSYPTSVGFDRI